LENPKTETDEPKRARALQEKELPTSRKSRQDMFWMPFPNLRTERLLPILTNDLIERLEPMCKQSRILMEEPMRETP
jgi:hypothetical protein